MPEPGVKGEAPLPTRPSHWPASRPPQPNEYLGEHERGQDEKVLLLASNAQPKGHAIQHTFVPSTYKQYSKDQVSIDPEKSLRLAHIRRMYDICHMLIQRGDLARASRVWTVLVGCDEVDLRAMWQISLLLVSHNSASLNVAQGEQQVRLLKELFAQSKKPEERISFLCERIQVLIMPGIERFDDALAELELYLPSEPFIDSGLLHLYAGYISLYLAQQAADRVDDSDDMDEDSEAAPSLMEHLLQAGQYALINTATRSFLRASTLEEPYAPIAKDWLTLIGHTPP
ncbi:uncharacterized protein L969DRAFT_20186 [Mixia osmundae IAM 14324]|uniref:Uncharacterized protein n=1 Tax=Mixia osmundae (strain CBS 9802 / IAM 14324 / JCM 22182 / KY 12970) TaxID=764103 RepID=G7DW47_MIXOS|nr:uncharacterized protein L969DRAFT_20186 [Mixia osmundae IAM 14324]KEI36449.1 hypothetical protein L969DRAFT_20186 [Mixia osmundae IAM 14324]GAA94853.1 hypothetical protein E5Q_01507 [Mixia osmundae IAM 14324]